MYSHTHSVHTHPNIISLAHAARRLTGMWHVLALSLLPLTPRLEVRFPENKALAQPDEYPMEWMDIYSEAFDTTDAELEQGVVGFWSWFYDNACKDSLRLAVEAEPFKFFVCARMCEEGSVPVIKFTPNGTRVRGCNKSV